MTKLPKEKRDRLILVVMGTAGLIFLISFGLIRNQYDALDQVRSQTTNARDKLLSIQSDIKKGPSETEAQDLSDALSRAEADMASGDTFQWTYDTVRNFKARYKVDVLPPTQPVTGDVDLLPKFPYKQIKVSVAGTAYYHDLGKFIADFENRFPHIRITNLTLDTAGANATTAIGATPAGSISEDKYCRDKIAFRMDIIALIKPVGPQS